MYKVFIYNKPIFFLSENETSDLSPNIKTYICENEEDKKGILTLHKFSSSDAPLYVYHKNLKKLMDLFFSQHKSIDAAGGIVENEKGEILFIDRLGYWDIPKGKVEKNEELKLAAIREIEEECGITGPTITKKLLSTFHTYSAKRKKYFKTTHWYLLKYKGNEPLIPQKEEGITDVRWVNPQDLSEQTSRTYNSILDVLESYLKKKK